MDNDYKRRVLERISDRPRLIAMFDSALDMPQRIQEYREHFFVCYNRVADKFEIHSLDQEGDTYCATVPFRELDRRTLIYLWQNDIRVHGKDLIRRIDEANEKMQKTKQKDFRSFTHDFAREHRSLFAKKAADL